MANSSSTADKSSAPQSPVKNAILIVVSLAALSLAIWYIYKQANQVDEYSFEIKDGAKETNYDNVTAQRLLDLPLLDEQLRPVSLREHLGKRHLVVIFTRGSQAPVPRGKKGPELPGVPNVCAYCSSQASGIASRLPEFKQQEAEVLLIFPITREAETGDATTLKNSAIVNPMTPVPVLLDMNLKATDQLGIRAHLARPASFIVDKAGDLRFAYVAEQGSADRPSAGELLRHLTQINGAATPQP